MPRADPSVAIIGGLYQVIPNGKQTDQRPRLAPRRLVILEQPLRKSINMTLLNILKSFKNDEAGAVTVDWVVLTAAIVGLGIVVMTTIGGGIETLSKSTATKITQQSVGYVSTP